MMLIDSIIVVTLLFLAFAIRLGYWYWPNEDLLLIIFSAPILVIPIFFSFGLYRSVIRFIGIKGFWSIGQSVSLYAVVWGLLSYMVSIEGIPRSVILINWMLCIIVIGGSRVFARWLFSDETKASKKGKINVIIYGAGSAGMELSQSLQLSQEYNHIAYIDDNLALKSTYINNIQVFELNQIEFLIEKYGIKDVFIALPSISRKQRNKIIANLTPLSLHVRSLPSIYEMAEGKVKVDDLREINVKDLLERELVKPNKNLLKTKITDKVVLVTGAGGSIGSELSRQIISLKPKKIILYEISESSLYQIDQELNNIGIINVEILPMLGSISSEKFQDICKYFQVQTIYHAAAYKHVPLVEYNQSAGVLNNSIGTMQAAKAAIAAKVETFVLISTDKAVRPTNIMGATKRIAELVLQGLAMESHGTCFTMVRFGNVLDSSGSVIPLFKKQIRDGGPITVTDKKIVRYFMTIPEAVELVIQAGAMGKGGDVFVLDMGEPVKIYDLAVKMIQLSGLQLLDNNNPDGDIEIKFTGLRPGEKLYEELLIGEKVIATDNKLIMHAEENFIAWESLEPIIKQLWDASLNSEQKRIREIITTIVPDFKPQSPIVDLLYKY
jgi:FlaA1/EpsC-like NDP-sugar epimerase